MINKSKQSSYSHYLKKLQQSNNNIFAKANVNKNRKPKQMIHDIVMQIDQIKHKLTQVSQFKSVHPKKRMSCDYLTPKENNGQDIDSEKRYLYKKLTKCKTKFETTPKRTLKNQRSLFNSVKKKKMCEEEMIKLEMKNLQEINKNLRMQNQKLNQQLFSQKIQKKQLRRILQSYNYTDSMKFTNHLNSKHQQNQVLCQQSYIKNHHNQSYKYKVSNQTTNHKIFQIHQNVNQQLMNGSFKTQKRQNIQIKDKQTFFEDDYINQTQQSYLKNNQVSQISFKQQNMLSQSRNQSLLLDQNQPQFGQILGSAYKQKEEKIMKQKLKCYEAKFNDLICESRIEKNAEKKTIIRKQLLEVANSLNMLKKKMGKR